MPKQSVQQTAIHIEPNGTLSVATFDALEMPSRIYITDDFGKKPGESGAGHFEESVRIDRINLHRRVVTPLCDLAKEPAEVRAAAKELWSPEFITAYRAAAKGK
jgi:hypothetical protein